MMRPGSFHEHGRNGFISVYGNKQCDDENRRYQDPFHRCVTGLLTQRSLLPIVTV